MSIYHNTTHRYPWLRPTLSLVHAPITSRGFTFRHRSCLCQHTWQSTGDEVPGKPCSEETCPLAEDWYLKHGFWLRSAVVQWCWTVSYIVETIVIQLSHLPAIRAEKGSSDVFILSMNEERVREHFFCAIWTILWKQQDNLFYPKISQRTVVNDDFFIVADTA